MYDQSKDPIRYAGQFGIIWMVFMFFLLGLPLIKKAQEPSDPSRADYQFGAVWDSLKTEAFVRHQNGLEKGDDYQVRDYCYDLVFLAGLRDRAPSSFDSEQMSRLIEALRYRSEESVAAALPDSVIKRSRLSADEARQMLTTSQWSSAFDLYFDEARREAGWRPLQDHLTWRGTVKFAWHFAKANLWTMLFTMLVLLLRLRFTKGYSVKEEVLCAPRRLFWAAFFWGSGGESYPKGEDPATALRFARLKRDFLSGKERWHLTEQEERVLWLMAHVRLERFDEAVEMVSQLGAEATARPRRAFVTSILVWIFSGPLSFARPGSAQAAEFQVQIEQTVGIPGQLALDHFPNHTGGVDHFFIVEPVAFGQPELTVAEVFKNRDQRNWIRQLRPLGSRAPPVIPTGGTR